MHSISYCIFIFLIVACGKTKSPHDDEIFIEQFSLETQGYYRAPFNLVNPKVSRGVKGRASFFINAVQFYAKINLSTPWRDISHVQMLHSGSHCPDKRDDLNKDSYIDATEVINASGKVLLSLDFNLKSNETILEEYPFSTSNGDYVFSRATSTPALMSDLWDLPYDILNYRENLNPNEDLSLNQRVVIIYGVPEHKILPSTVLALEGHTTHATLPIACGRFTETQEVFP